MAIVPVQLARVSNLLRTSVSQGQITRTQQELLRVQNQLSTGRRLNAPSDDPGDAAIVQQLQKTLEQREAYLANLQHAESHLSEADTAMADLTGVLQEAQQIASANVGSDVTPDQRTAELQRMVPMLRSLGIDEQMLAQVDLSDRGLENIVNQSRDIENVIKGRTPDVQAVPGVGLYSVTPGSPHPDFSAGGARPGAQIGPAAGIPPEAIADLQANPATAAQFDEVFGQGAADRVLGGGGAGNGTGGFLGY